MQALLRIKDVLNVTGLKRSGLYQRVSDGNFPKPIQIGPRCVAWVASEVDSWIGKCIEETRAISKNNYSLSQRKTK